MSAPTAHWNVAVIAMTCPHCGYDVGLVRLSKTGYYRPGATIPCDAPNCLGKFRIPALLGAHGINGRGFYGRGPS